MGSISRLAAVLGLLLLSNLVFATNGYWSHGYGPKSKSMGGACVAMTFGAMCSAVNPGSLAVVGNRLELGLALFAPTRGFVADDNGMTPPFASIPAGKYESENEIFFIPHVAYNRMLDEVSSIGFAFGGNGGMNTEYDSDIFRNFNNPMGAASSPTGVDMMQAFLGITYSRKLNDQHSIGITPVLTVQAFEAYGLEPFQMFSATPDKVTNQGVDYSWGGGLKLGWLWQVNKRLTIGAAYQSRLYMTEFEEYEGLFAEGGDFDVPSNVDLGFAYKVTDSVTLAFNYQRINYDEVAAIGNPADMAFVPPGPYLGCDDCLGFGWDDVEVFKYGVEWVYNDQWTFRAGYSYATDAFEGGQALFNVIAPAVTKEHFTAGFGTRLSSDSELNVAFSYMPEHEIHGTNPNTGPQTGHLYMDQWEIEVGWAKRF